MYCNESLCGVVYTLIRNDRRGASGGLESYRLTLKTILKELDLRKVVGYLVRPMKKNLQVEACGKRITYVS